MTTNDWRMLGDNVAYCGNCVKLARAECGHLQRPDRAPIYTAPAYLHYWSKCPIDQLLKLEISTI